MQLKVNSFVNQTFVAYIHVHVQVRQKYASALYQVRVHGLVARIDCFEGKSFTTPRLAAEYLCTLS